MGSLARTSSNVLIIQLMMLREKPIGLAPLHLLLEWHAEFTYRCQSAETVSTSHLSLHPQSLEHRIHRV